MRERASKVMIYNLIDKPVAGSIRSLNTVASGTGGTKESKGYTHTRREVLGLFMGTAFRSGLHYSI